MLLRTTANTSTDLTDVHCVIICECAQYTGDADISADYKWSDPVAKVVIAPRSTY
jgi:hypothetical protein